MNPDMTFVVAGTVTLVLAAITALFDRRDARRHREALARGTRAEGVVSRISLPFHRSRNKPTDEDRRHSVPVVRFRASNGVEYEFSDSSAPHEVGATVEVVYDPALPSGAKLVTRKSGLGCAAVLMIVSIAAFVWAFRSAPGS